MLLLLLQPLPLMRLHLVYFMAFVIKLDLQHAARSCICKHRRKKKQGTIFNYNLRFDLAEKPETSFWIQHNCGIGWPNLWQDCRAPLIFMALFMVVGKLSFRSSVASANLKSCRSCRASVPTGAACVCACALTQLAIDNRLCPK